MREGRRVFSEAIYKGRNVVERCVGWLKQNRRLSTRLREADGALSVDD